MKRTKTSKIINTSKIIKYLSTSALGLVACAAVVAVAGMYNNDGANAASSAEVEFSATIEPSVNISLTSTELSLALDPGSTPFATASVPVTISSNSDSGYALYLTSDSTVLTRTIANDNDQYPTIPTLGSGTFTQANFTTNAWGWTTDGTNYHGATGSDKIASAASLSGSTTVNVGFGAKVDYSQPAGTYKNKFNLVGVSNANATLMQHLAASKCTTTPSLVYDGRDGTAYTIQRLTDGKCWMLDNLALDLTTVSLESLKGNTNAEDDTLTYLKNGGGSGKYTATGVIAKTATGGSWTNSYNVPYIVTSGTNNGGWTKDTVPANSKYNNNGGSYKIGYYYNYCAASAGSYCYAQSAGVDTADTLVDAAEDICPAGWHMPTSDLTQDSDYGKLCWLIKGSACASSISSNPMSNSDEDSLQYALSTPLSGFFSGGAANNQGSYGYFWSSTFNSTSNMRRLYVSATGVNPQSSDSRGSGYPVRCVLGS